MNKPLVSVIVPCYNVENYLDKCIDSIVNQSYPNLEIWLVDDGAKDSTPKIIDDWAKRDNRIKVIHKTNGGLSDARNVAIDRAAGDYLVFVDSDDYIATDHIEYLISIIDDADIVMTWCVPFMEGTEPNHVKKESSKPKIYKLSAEDALKKMFYQRGIDTSAWGKLYKKSLFSDEIRYPKGWLFEDLPTTYRLLLNAQNAVYSSYNSYFYLLRSNSIEGSAFNPQKYESAINIINRLESDRHKMSTKSQKALNSRILSFIFHLLLQIPNSQKAMQREMFNKVKKYRWKVIKDFNARPKARIAALVSYLGLPVVHLLQRKGFSR